MYGVRAVSRTYGLHHGQSSRKVTVAFATLLHMLQVSYNVMYTCICICVYICTYTYTRISYNVVYVHVYTVYTVIISRMNIMTFFSPSNCKSLFFNLSIVFML